MFIGDPPRAPTTWNSDRGHGGKFFTPIVDFLNDPPPLPDSEPEEDQQEVAAAPVATNGSLGIGSLKGTRQ